MAALHHRSSAPEWMDGDDVTQAEFAACLSDLARVNTLTLVRRPTLAFVGSALKAHPDRTLTLLDVGFGGGDMLRAIRRRAEAMRRDIRLIGIDINPRSEPIARDSTPAALRIDYRTGDAYTLAESEPIDLVISSHVTHHMEDADIVRFLKWMEARASRGWFVNDLHRHWFAYHGFRLLAAAMRWHPFVRHDGPISVMRSFRRNEWESLLASAGLAGTARVEAWIPFRYAIVRRKWQTTS